jgi:hypothetical protein
VDAETIIDFFSGRGGSVDFSNKYDYLNICENEYLLFYSSTIEALNFLNTRSYYELYDEGYISSALAEKK